MIYINDTTHCSLLVNLWLNEKKIQEKMQGAVLVLDILDGNSGLIKTFQETGEPSKIKPRTR